MIKFRVNVEPQTIIKLSLFSWTGNVAEFKKKNSIKKQINQNSESYFECFGTYECPLISFSQNNCHEFKSLLFYY